MLPCQSNFTSVRVNIVTDAFNSYKKIFFTLSPERANILPVCAGGPTVKTHGKSGMIEITTFQKLLYKLFFITLIIFISFRSSHRRCSVRKKILRNFANFTEKHLYQGLLFNKVAG